MRWQYRDRGLLWPFVPAYAIHVTEEWFGGFTTWVAQVAGRPMAASAFFGINLIAMLLLIAGVRAASRRDGHGWMAVAIAAIALINTASHLGGALITNSYAPGLISAVILYVPLGSLTLIRAVDQAPKGTLIRGVSAGALLHTVAMAAAFAATR